MPRKGFTFIEMLVTISIIALIVPTLFGLFFLLIRTQIESIALAKVKKEGDRIRATIISDIRNNGSGFIDGTCSTILFGGSYSYAGTACVQGGSALESSGAFGYAVDNLNLYAYTSEPTRTALMANDAGSYFPLEASQVDDSEILYIISDDVIRVRYRVTYKPRTAMVREQSLSYSFFVTLRK